jgi:leishmanolysin-like peptidase
MVTPKVVEEARLHFDCPTMEGAELEDQGGDGTALTHWEKRIFQARMFILHKTTTL